MNAHQRRKARRACLALPQPLFGPRMTPSTFVGLPLQPWQREIAANIERQMASGVTALATIISFNGRLYAYQFSKEKP